MVSVSSTPTEEALTELLNELYEGHGSPSHYELDTDSFTEETSGSFYSDFGSPFENRRTFSFVDNTATTAERKQLLEKLNTLELKEILGSLKAECTAASQQLIRNLKRRDHQKSRRQARINILTAVLQARSDKTSADTKLQFALEPASDDRADFERWRCAMRAVVQLPDGLPSIFRMRMWLALGDASLREASIDFRALCRRVFSDRPHPEDERLGAQIIKDLHRTGWSGLCGERERVVLKRVLLAYARHNPATGYCQGLNVIAASLYASFVKKQHSNC